MYNIYSKKCTFYLPLVLTYVAAKQIRFLASLLFNRDRRTVSVSRALNEKKTMKVEQQQRPPILNISLFSTKENTNAIPCIRD